MNNNSMIFMGLDTHKEFDEVAYCEDEMSILRSSIKTSRQRQDND